MRLPTHISQKKKGFTLIELLIVIGILGILAAGLLAALDPLEQLRRGRDTNRRRVSTELVGALNRYYSVVGSFPWGNVSQSYGNITTLENTVIGSLVTAGELKSSFFNAIPGGAATINLQAVQSGTGFEVYSCFRPEAKSGTSDQSSIYTATNPPATGSGCPGGATATCYFCAR